MSNVAFQTPYEDLRDSVRMWVKDPVILMDKCGWHLWDKQKEIARSVFQNERTAVPASFGIGKTYVAARIAATFLNLYAPCKVITTAPTMRQVSDLLWSEFRKAYRVSRIRLKGEPLKTRLELTEDWYAIGFSTGDDEIDKFTGYHSPNILIIFDQACGISRTMWEAAEGLMTSANCHWLAISNTTDDQSVMADICIPDRRHEFGDWEIVHINAHMSPNVQAGKDIYPGLISYKWLEKKQKIWNVEDPLWQIFVEAQFVSASAMVILTRSMINNMFGKEMKPDFNDIDIGLDVGDEGADSSVWIVRAGKRLLFIHRVTGNDPMKVVKETEKVWKKTIKLTDHKPNVIKVDKIGVGSGVVSRLLEKDYPAEGINVSSSPYDKEQFLNARAEMGWQVRELAEANSICLIPLFHTEDENMAMLREELGVRYQFGSSGKIQMEPKEKIRKRLKRSPDFWDSMMLCYGEESQLPKISLVGDASDSVEKKEKKEQKIYKEKVDKDMEKLTGQNIDIEADFVEEE